MLVVLVTLIRDNGRQFTAALTNVNVSETDHADASEVDLMIYHFVLCLCQTLQFAGVNKVYKLSTL